MSISGVGSGILGYQPPAAKTAAQQAQAAAAQSASQDTSAASGTSNTSNKAVQDFLAYMKELPGQRMEDAWLKAHGLTEQELAKMPPDKQAAIRKEMAADIKQQLEEQMQKKTGADTAGGAATGSLANIVA